MILIGASGHAKVILDILEQNEIKVECLVDANPSLISLCGYAVVHDSVFNFEGKDAILSIGSNEVRKKLNDLLPCTFKTAIHPKAILDKTVKVGEGTVVMAGVVLNRDVAVGKHVIINTSASVDHDNHIKDYVHISPNATLCGTVTVGEGTHIGAGATIIPNISIGKWAIIGAGAVVISDIPDFAVAVGNPARIIKYINE
ncbi:acetyltransferase [Roseivirga echinicomitans]|uniref:Acetyltransferase n=1 Tax=Roseivirga echinicomitans TaxID=296218 RepID=A0A150XVT2_9BACT|nr:acetyltransferase [Roseivirga echinicomitans]KYG82871.1 acetyltransferase [Roseivirga echinicomitans]